MKRRRRRNPDAYALGTVAEYGKRRRSARIDARMMATRTGKLTGYLGEDERHRLVMLRPREITGTHRAESSEMTWVKVLIGVGVVVGVLWLLGRAKA